MKNPKIFNQKGSLLVEVVIATVILGIALISFAGLGAFSLSITNFVERRTMALDLAQEAIEAVRNIRDGSDWNTSIGSLNIGSDYSVQKTAGTPVAWILAAGQENINGFTRKIIFEDVRRDGLNNIVESGGVVDPQTKKVKVIVSFENKKVEIYSYITNWVK